MTLLKLAFNNVRKSFRDFTVYFLTLTLGVSIFYIFNSIEGQQAVMSLTSGQANALKSLNTIMSNFSIFIAVILGFLIIYANRYLIKRRKQEFGIYMTLGMGRGRISWILVLETIFVGLIALVAGSVLGILLSQAMALLTAKLLGAGIASFEFIFSLEALKESVLYFGLTFGLVMIFNVIMVRRQKLIDLIYASRRNERFKTPRLTVSVLIFLVALACLGVSYFVIISQGLLSLTSMSISIGLGVVGTFLFFFSLSGFFLKLVQQIKSVYLRGLNMFVLRQINSKINTMYVSITLVCLMLFASICTLSSGMGLARAVTADVMRSLPYDASLSVNRVYDFEIGGYQPYVSDGIDLMSEINDENINLSSFARDYAALRYYGDNLDSLDIEGFDGDPVEAELFYVKLTDYNRAMSLQGGAPLELPQGEFAVDSTTANTEWVNYAKPQIFDQKLAVGGKELRTDPSLIFTHSLEASGNPNLDFVIVVPDELLADEPVKRDVLNLQYRDASPSDEAQAVQALSGLGGIGLDNRLETKTLVVERSSSNTTTIAYLAVYLGIIFILASATVLSITQLSEASDNVRRYKLLHKIGTSERMINRAVFQQMAVYYGAPLALALVHSWVGITVATNLIESFRGSDILTSSLITAAIVVVVYGGYFLATYQSSKNVISREYARQDKEG
jgi:putative ABC transport system permease protein